MLPTHFKRVLGKETGGGNHLGKLSSSFAACLSNCILMSTQGLETSSKYCSYPQSGILIFLIRRSVSRVSSSFFCLSHDQFPLCPTTNSTTLPLTPAKLQTYPVVRIQVRRNKSIQSRPPNRQSRVAKSIVVIRDSAPPSCNAYSYDTINHLIDEPMQIPGLYPLDRSLQVWILGLEDPMYLCRFAMDEEMTDNVGHSFRFECLGASSPWIEWKDY